MQLSGRGRSRSADWFHTSHTRKRDSCMSKRHFFSPGERCEVLWRVRLSVCLSIRHSHNSKTTRPNFAEFFWLFPVAVQLMASSDGVAIKLSTSGSPDDVIFHTIEPMARIKHDAMYRRNSPGGDTSYKLTTSILGWDHPNVAMKAGEVCYVWSTCRLILHSVAEISTLCYRML